MKIRKWFQKAKKKHSGWRKVMSEGARRARLLKAHKGDYLSSARSAQVLANVTQDPETKRRARADALYFYKLYKKFKYR